MPGSTIDTAAAHACGGAWLTEVDVVLTLRNLTAEALEGIGNGEVDYRAEYYREIERTRSSTLV